MPTLPCIPGGAIKPGRVLPTPSLPSQKHWNLAFLRFDFSGGTQDSAHCLKVLKFIRFVSTALFSALIFLPLFLRTSLPSEEPNNPGLLKPMKSSPQWSPCSSRSHGQDLKAFYLHHVQFPRPWSLSTTELTSFTLPVRPTNFGWALGLSICSSMEHLQYK